MEVLLTFGVFAAAMTGLSIGVILNNRALGASCGGAAVVEVGGESMCGGCGKKEVDLCPTDHDLVRIAQLGHPNPAHHR